MAGHGFRQVSQFWSRKATPQKRPSPSVQAIAQRCLDTEGDFAIGCFARLSGAVPIAIAEVDLGSKKVVLFAKVP